MDHAFEKELVAKSEISLEAWVVRFLTITVFAFQLSGCNEYAVEDGAVYYETTSGGGKDRRKLEGADSASFTQLNRSFGKDKNYVYYRNERIPHAKPATFKPLGAGYSKDSFNVFSESERVDRADVKTFRVVGGYGVDKDHAYDWTGPRRVCDARTLRSQEKWYLDDICVYDRGLQIVGGVDKRTFKILDRTYAKDAARAYVQLDFPKEKKFASEESSEVRVVVDVCHMGSLRASDGWLVDRSCVYDKFLRRLKGVDRKSFVVIDEFYARDGGHVYFQSGLVIAADPASARTDCFQCLRVKGRCFERGVERLCSM